MSLAFLNLSNSDLQDLSSSLTAGRTSAPYSELQVSRIVSANVTPEVTQSLIELERAGFDEQQIGITLQILLKDRLNGRRVDADEIDLVTSGPETSGVTNRDTSVVVRELFAHAKKSVLIAGYAVYQGTSVFEALAARMEAISELDVTMYLNIARADGDTTKAEIIVSRYAQRFRDSQWPEGCRLPTIFYDPRSVDENKRSSLHAKCVVVDDHQTFVSSANFTKAAHERNIEVGLLIRSEYLAKRVSTYFRLLREKQIVIKAPT